MTVESTTPSFAQIPPQSSGLKIRTVQVTDSNGDVVDCQAIVLADPVTAAYVASVSPFGELSVTGSQNSLLIELIAHTKRIARLLEIFTDTEVTIADAE